jgi:hypothetical protein
MMHGQTNIKFTHALAYRAFIPESGDKSQDVPYGIWNAQTDRKATELHLSKLHNYSWFLLRCAMGPTSQDVITSPASSGLLLQLGTLLHLTAY